MRVLVAMALLPRGTRAQAPVQNLGHATRAAIHAADSMVRQAVGHTTAGAVLLIARDGRLLHLAAYGDAERLDSTGAARQQPRPMRPDTRFDLASVTKVMATTLAIMTLVDDGTVALDTPVVRYLPEFHGPHLDSITVRHLLRHASGLTPWQPLYYSAANKREALAAIARLPLATGVGAGRHYSDLGFMLLGYIVERVSGEALDRYVARRLYQPLGLRHTGFTPDRTRRDDFAATEVGNGYEHRMVHDTTFAFPYRGDPAAWNGWRTRVLNGEANDGNAYYAHGGVAGHAGLFSTAADLRVLLQLLLDDGRFGGRKLISRATIHAFLTPEPFGHYLGFMRPNRLPDGSFMHTGFTGTYLLGVPSQRLLVVLLANRQQMGADSTGRFPDLAALRDGVSRRLSEATARDGSPRR
jgi:CubicO group peptidase (beta-lactamase class C family)